MTTVEHEIRRQEEELAAARRTLDLDTIDRLYADDLILTGVLGEPMCTKGAVLEEIRRGIAQRDDGAAGTARVASADCEDMKVVALGDTAVANYRFVVTITGTDVNVRRRYRTTNVWTKRAGRWQIVAAQMGLVLEPSQAAALAG